MLNVSYTGLVKQASDLQLQYFNTNITLHNNYMRPLTLEPPDLRGGTVAFLIACCDAEYDGWFSGVVDVCGGETGRGDHTLWDRSAVNAYEG